MRPRSLSIRLAIIAILVAVAVAAPRATHAADGLNLSDLEKLQSVGEVRLSADGSHVVYAVARNDRPGRPYSTLWIMDVGAGTPKALLPDGMSGNAPRWSSDGKWIAFIGSDGKEPALMIVHPDGTN